MSKIAISEAGPSELASLSTIVQRSFHPVSPYHQRLFPDTPLLRQWWHQVFSSEEEDAACDVLTAVDLDIADLSKRVIGVLCLRLCGLAEGGGGLWIRHLLTADYDADLYASTMAPMIKPRQRIMRGRRHFLLELFGVDHAYKGTGIGKMLLQRACQIADEAGHDVFVEANISARAFYLKFGFEQREEVAMPSEQKYLEYLLVRTCR